MTSDELERVFGAMTDRPWRQDGGVIECDAELTRDDTNTIIALGPNCDANDAAIIALANHADAFMELVRACEDEVLNDMDGWDFVDRIKAALAKVHAVGKD